MKNKILALILSLFFLSLYSQDFTLIGDYTFDPLLIYNNKMIGFTKDNNISNFISTDGTSEGAIILEENLRAPYPHWKSKGLGWTVYDDKVYYAAGGLSSIELWVTDGSQIGTYRLKKLLSNPNIYGNPKYFKNYNGKFYFNGLALNENDYTEQIWESDGTEEGTQVLTVLPYSNLHLPNERIPEPCKFNVLNDKLYFEAYENELWKTDGTAEGTEQVKNIGFNHRIISEIIPFQDKLIFVTNIHYTSPGTEYNLWVSDGTTDGTYILQELEDRYSPDEWGNNNSQTKRRFTVYDDKLYFMTLNNLRVTDGTAEGTSIVQTFENGLGDRSYEIINHNGKMYFIQSSYDLWESDGTTEGTSIIQGPNDSWTSIGGLALSNNLLYFFAYNGTTYSLWTSDGTIENTYEIGSPVSHPNEFLYSSTSTYSYEDSIYTSTHTPFVSNSLNQFWKLESNALTINSFNFDSRFIIWPNPIGNSVTVNSKIDIKNIQIYDNLGQVLTSKSNSKLINTSNLTSGIYFIRIECINGEIHIEKVIKK